MENNLTSKDGFALRKSGDIKAAYELAKNLMAKDPNDEWNIKLYAWVLIDLCKANKNNSEIFKQFISELKSINLLDDEILRNQYQFIMNLEMDLENPLKRTIKEAGMLRKDGKYRLALNKILPLDINALDEFTSTTYAWVIYDAIRHGVFSHIDEFKKGLNNYLRLPIAKPDLVHSLILAETIKFLKDKNINNFNFVIFLKMWGVDNFRPEDYKEEKFKANDGKIITYSPLIIKALMAGADYLREAQNINGDITWFMEFLKIIADKYNHIWLKRDYALIMHKFDKNSQAIEIYRSLLADLGDKSYFWDEFGDFVYSSDMHMAKNMYIKAVSLNKDDFVAGIRLKLAKTLYNLKKLEYAKFELDRYIAHRSAKEYKIDPQASSLQHALANIEAKNDKELLNSANNAINEYLYSNVPLVECVYYDSYTNKNGKKFYKFTNFNDIDINLNTKEFKEKLKLYSCLRLQLITDNSGKSKLIKYEKSAKNIEDFSIGSSFKRVEGNIRLICNIDGKNINYKDANDANTKPLYGFVDDIYVSKNLLEVLNLKDNETLIVVASKNNKKNKYSAIYIKRVEL